MSKRCLGSRVVAMPFYNTTTLTSCTETFSRQLVYNDCLFFQFLWCSTCIKLDATMTHLKRPWINPTVNSSPMCHIQGGRPATVMVISRQHRPAYTYTVYIFIIYRSEKTSV